MRSHDTWLLREIDDLVATKELQIHLAIQSPAFINGNKLLIEKVFSNLISNAVSIRRMEQALILFYKIPTDAFCSP